MRYLLIVVVAWLAAQGAKHLVRALGRNQRVFHGNPRSPLLLSGGMPSAHAAASVALMAAVGWYDGVDNGVFAVAASLAVVIMYDAVMVRFSSGQQGDLLNRLITLQKLPLQRLKIAHGHTVVEVLAGAVLGMAVAFVVIFATK